MLILKPRKNQGKTQKQPGQGWETVDENMGKRKETSGRGRKSCKMEKNQAKKSRNAGCSLKKGRKGDRIAKNGHDKKALSQHAI